MTLMCVGVINPADDTTPYIPQVSCPASNVIIKDGSRGRSGGKMVVCYYSLPHTGSPSPAPLLPLDLDPSLCTHLVVNGAQVVNASITPLQPQNLKVYTDVVRLKQQVPGLQVLLSLHHGLVTLAKDRLAVSMFAYMAGRFLKCHGFDGLNVDWEGPVPRTYTDVGVKTAPALSYLLLQLNNALKLASHPPMLLTATVGSSSNSIDSLYDADVLKKLVDFVSVRCYNFHMYSPLLPFTGHNAPLRPAPNDLGYWQTLNLQWAVRHWLKVGLPSSQLVAGISTFGRTWKLKASEWNSVGSPAKGPGMFNGTMTYPETCIFLQEGATQHYDSSRLAPYATRDNDWISYEDPTSLTQKVTWVMEEDVAGVMLEDLNSDDWAGICGGVRYPLLHTASHALVENK
ncbi:hypothetical protein Pcinc_007665 [Petrolisthes cinctipes]|uniref:GH18 domain-containing protein n=1 Tax=Petrolisthes cinctipes TaxID=88211 RepID=A0AAE1KYB4_PETCI|nr:hypothetical protein Pcinc_007665 [Petrolisthes cinctipes]